MKLVVENQQVNEYHKMKETCTETGTIPSRENQCGETNKQTNKKEKNTRIF